MTLSRGATAKISVNAEVHIVTKESVSKVYNDSQAVFNTSYSSMLGQQAADDTVQAGKFVDELMPDGVFQTQALGLGVTLRQAPTDATKALLTEIAGLTPQAVVLSGIVTVEGLTKIPRTYTVCIDMVLFEFASSTSLRALSSLTLYGCQVTLSSNSEAQEALISVNAGTAEESEMVVAV